MSQDARVSCAAPRRGRRACKGSAVDPIECFPLGLAPETGPCAPWCTVVATSMRPYAELSQACCKRRRDTGRTSPSLTSFVLGEAGQRRTFPRRCSAFSRRMPVCRGLGLSHDRWHRLRGVGLGILMAQRIVSEHVGRPPRGSGSSHRRPVMCMLRAGVAGLHRQHQLLCACSPRTSHE